MTIGYSELKSFDGKKVWLRGKVGIIYQLGVKDPVEENFLFLIFSF